MLRASLLHIHVSKDSHRKIYLVMTTLGSIDNTALRAIVLGTEVSKDSHRGIYLVMTTLGSIAT